MRIDSISAIGKESNNLEEVEAGLVHDEQDVFTEYADRRRDYWSIRNQSDDDQSRETRRANSQVDGATSRSDSQSHGSS